MIVVAETPEGITFGVRVVARASRTAIAGEHDGALKLRVAAPPVGGAANEELTRFLARALGVAAGAVEIVSGRASRSKVVRVRVASAASLGRLAGEAA
ncbi:MAG TPA: DUF167 domain-containing protein [Pyrinomonadaceae bacterium]|nr:DUF167 domain-containing protein [Pyrinomonadaceae bacterium]